MRNIFYFAATLCALAYLLDKYPVVMAHGARLIMSGPTAGEPCPEANPLGLNRRGERIECVIVRQPGQMILVR